MRRPLDPAGAPAALATGATTPGTPAAGATTPSTPAAGATTPSTPAAGATTPGTPATGATTPGALAPWLAHQQLGVAAQAIAAHVTRALGAVPTEVTAIQDEELRGALAKSARRLLHGASRERFDATPADALRQAAREALDTAARESIEAAAREQSLDPAPMPADRAADRAVASVPSPPGARVLVTVDPDLVAGDWHAQRIHGAIRAHTTALRDLATRTEDAVQELGSQDPLVAGPAGKVTGDLTGDAATAPLALGLELLALARSETTVSTHPVTPGEHELLIRGAAALAASLGEAGRVVADTVTTVADGSSPLTTALEELLAARHALATGAAVLAGRVGAQNPLIGRVAGQLTLLDQDLAAWCERAGTGAPPLLRAVARERLHGGETPFTHVLVLQDEGLTADTVQRHSILGSSSRITHLGTATTSWLLVTADTGVVVAGGQEQPAGRLVQDLHSGRTAGSRVDPARVMSLPADRHRLLEHTVTALVACLGVASLALAAYLVTLMVSR